MFVTMHWDNFGFTGPSSSEDVRNYRSSSEIGPRREFSIPVPDPIDGASATLLFVVNEYSEGDKVTINGKDYAIPSPTSRVINGDIPLSSLEGGYISSAIAVENIDNLAAENTLVFSQRVISPRIELRSPCSEGGKQYTAPVNSEVDGFFLRSGWPRSQ